jgi:hypothetical protein
MKNILILVAGLLSLTLSGQTSYTISGSNSGITTAETSYFQGSLHLPATIWYPIDTLAIGIDSCDHKWYHSEPYSYSGGFGRGYSISCAVLHAPGTRCSWTIQTRKSICSKCFWHIIEQDEDPNPKPVVPIVPVETYETILQRLNKKE